MSSTGPVKELPNFSTSSTSSTSSPSSPVAMADCLQLFSAAISAPPSSSTQRTELARLKHHFQASPAVLPILYPSLLALIAQPSSSPYLTKWVATIIELAICRPLAPPDQKLQLVLQSTETIHKLLTLQDSSHLETKKNAIQAAATSYPLIFKHALSKPTPDPRPWGFASQTKSIILSLWRSESSPLGLRLAAIKYVQRIVQVGTRGAADPRKRGEDPSVAMCAATPHAFLRPKELEAESNTLLEETVRMLFQTKSPEVASAIIIATGTLVRLRPALAPLIISTLSSYVPTTSPLIAQATQLKGVEKTLRITLSYLDRASPTPAVREALIAQVKRVDEINERETDRKRQRREEDMVAKKRIKIQQQHQIEDPVEGADSLAVAPNQVDQQLPGFDVTSLRVDLVIELVVANLLVLTEQTLHDALTNFCRTLPSDSCIPVPNQHAPAARPTTPNQLTPTSPVVNTASPVRPKMELILPTSQPFVDVKPDPDEAAAPKSVFLDNWEPERPVFVIGFLLEQRKNLSLLSSSSRKNQTLEMASVDTEHTMQHGDTLSALDLRPNSNIQPRLEGGSVGHVSGGPSRVGDPSFRLARQRSRPGKREREALQASRLSGGYRGQAPPIQPFNHNSGFFNDQQFLGPSQGHPVAQRPFQQATFHGAGNGAGSQGANSLDKGGRIDRAKRVGGNPRKTRVRRDKHGPTA